MNQPLSSACQNVLGSLTRYETHINQLGFAADYYMVDFMDIEWKPQESQSEIQKMEKKIGILIPPELFDIWTELGAFELPSGADWACLSIFSSGGDSRPLAKGLIDAIIDVWGDRPEINDYLTPAQINEINRNFFCFGIYKHDDNGYSYLCFDRNKRADVFFYDQDRWDEFEADVIHKKLLTKAPLTQSVTEVIAKAIDILIESKRTEYSESAESSGEASEKFQLKLTMPSSNSSAGNLAIDSSTDSNMEKLNVALRPFLLDSNSEGVFVTLRDWPDKDAIWIQYAKNRIIAPSCTEEHRKVLKVLILENS